MSEIDFRNSTFEELKMGGGNKMTTCKGVMRYVSGTVSRERSRIADVLRRGDWVAENLKTDGAFMESISKLADAIENPPIEIDRQVFLWAPDSVKFMTPTASNELE